MEGYTDCIIARQYGFENVLAVLGTALGERHIRLLRRFADRIVLVLDGDEAGQKRTGEVLSLFVAEQVDLRIVTLPDDLDPCDFLLEHGADEFRKQLDSPVDALGARISHGHAWAGYRQMPHQAQVALDGLAANDRQGAAVARGNHQRNADSPMGDDGPAGSDVWHRRRRAARAIDRTSRQAATRAKAPAVERRACGRAQARRSATGCGVEPLNPWDRELLEILLLEPEAVRRWRKWFGPSN